MTTLFDPRDSVNPRDDEVARLRVPPHSVEAEQSVLGGLLLDNLAWDRATDFSALNGKQRQAAFVQANRQAAQAAEEQTGIPATFMLAQAAHESGWGQRAIRNADGSSANNLFGIKAGAGWKGAVAEVVTTEFVDGQPKKLVQRFRAYASAEESFRDYARLMTQNSRYSQVLASGGDAQRFAQGLQAAGYATDPAYAEKLGRVINTTLRLQRAAA